MKKLTVTDHQRRQFAAELMASNYNVSAAAKVVGWSSSHAHRMLGDPALQSAVEAAAEARLLRTQINADWLLLQLAQEATADMADLYDEGGEIKPVADWPLIWRQGLVTAVESAALPNGENKVTRVRLADRTKIKEMIGKHVNVNAFVERREVSGPGGAPIASIEWIVNGVAREICAPEIPAVENQAPE